MEFHLKKIISKKTLLLLMLFLLVLFYLWKVPFTHVINKSITALQINGKDKTEKKVCIIIKGTYDTFIFGDDVFSGNLIIDGYDFTNEICTVNINHFPNNFEELEYSKFDGPRIETNKFGMIFADYNFNSFVIIPFKEYLDNPDYIGSGGSIEMDGSVITVICYPASVRNTSARFNRK